MCFKRIRLLKVLLPEYLVIVYLAIDCQRYRPIFASKRLCASIDSDNAEAFVDEDGVVGKMVSAPIWSTMSHCFAHTQGSRFEFHHIWVASKRLSQ